MIRINLLPNVGGKKKRQASSSGPSGGVQLWGGIYLVAAFLWLAALGALYFFYDGKLTEQKRQNEALAAQIEQLRSKSARLEEVRAQYEESTALEEVVTELNKGRTGPTRMMMEISKILSVGEGSGPTIDPQELEEMRRNNPLAGFNRSWDVRRLWVLGFEEDHGNCKMVGEGRTNEDVAEFLRRLALSDLFADVTLERTTAATPSNTSNPGVPLIRFELSCRVTY